MGLGCTPAQLLLLPALLLLLPLLLVVPLRAQREEDPGSPPAEDRDLGKAILEMLHINKLSTPHRAKPHPYMKQVYLFLGTQEAQDRAGSDGTLVQSFRSIKAGWKHGAPGWIWFNVSHLKPSVALAELVLLRKTLHPEPLGVSVAVHSFSPRGGGNLSLSEPLEERRLTLDRLPPSGYDVFNVTGALARRGEGGALGFQLRYTDESGSLVLHEALTRSLYCLDVSSQSEPLLVAYQERLGQRRSPARGPERRQRQHCSAGRKRHLPPPPPPQPPGTARCRLHHRYVDFHTGHLANWILEPVGFNSSFCRGTCDNGETTEASIEDRHNGRHSRNGTGCFPQELSSLIVMYRSDTGNIEIETLRNMRAESCVCRPNDPK
ncbi:bone morphogenetic protein 2 [Conger conger]|uniref:bone morphogenetic protein 2 n=1 Tax=Conger conger TaxID=82655 RepID=UPI002A59A38A|nr:bone morphogenetic protein 2 [Conger conger]